jgi:hypothetical protein
MSHSRSVFTALGIERSSSRGIDAGAVGRVARSQVNERPLAACFPRDDRAFAEHVRYIFDGPHFEPFAAAIQALLRDTYPLAVISPRHELAALNGALVWYAFRDGSAVPDVGLETIS